MRVLRRGPAILLALGLLLFASGARALDLELYARLLEQHTQETSDTAGTRVDYAALVDSAPWKKLVQSLANSDLTKLKTREERLAFWINAYNILAIETVRANYPLASIRDVGSFFSPVWDREAGRIAGKPYTLGQIEHEILRPMGEPRIHVSIVCASTSCPSLRRKPFRAEDLDATFERCMRRFLANPEKGLRVDEGAKQLHLSKIFDWFKDDFARGGGVVKSLAPYMSEAARQFVEAQNHDPSISYLSYDWTLNDVERR